jgi:hypothetical protein
LNNSLKSVALATTFFLAALAMPVNAQEVQADTTNTVTQEQESQNLADTASKLRDLLQKPNTPRPPTPEEEQAYQELQSLLQSDLEKSLVPLRELEEKFQNGSIDEQTYQKELEELRSQRRGLWQNIVNEGLGKPYIDLPEIFSRSAQGCTSDNHKVELSVDLIVNMEDIKKLLGLNTNIVEREDWGGYKQIIITDEFLDTIDSALRAKIKHALERVTENVIENNSLETLGSAQAILEIQNAFDKTSSNIRETNNLRVIIKPHTIKDLTQSCAPIETPEAPNNNEHAGTTGDIQPLIPENQQTTEHLERNQSSQAQPKFIPDIGAP